MSLAAAEGDREATSGRGKAPRRDVAGRRRRWDPGPVEVNSDLDL